MRPIYLIALSLIFIFSCEKENFDDLDKDTHNVQQRLDTGETPFQIFQSGVPMEHIFGKEYLGGYIFYMNGETGEGKVCGTHDCYTTHPTNTEISWTNNAALSVATNHMAPADPNWTLPTYKELLAIHSNLHRLRLVDFTLDVYWTSEFENGKVIAIDFTSNTNSDPVYLDPTEMARVRAVKNF
jgi:hypothetical protein